jgi:hypothetical protein
MIFVKVLPDLCGSVIINPYFSCIRMFNHLPNHIKSLDFNIKKHKKLLKKNFQKHPFYSIDEYLMYKE